MYRDSMQEEIDVTDIKRLTHFIENKYDYDFNNYAISSYRRRVKRVLELYKLSSVDDLIKKLTASPSFFQEFVSEITVNVTEMFRDPSYWKLLKEDVIPELFNQQERINIWHAGCSSGEEVFTMTILLEEMGLLDRSYIVATDIDLSIIDKAKQASIRLKNMELNQQNYERYGGKKSIWDYFTQEGNYAKFSPSLLRHTSFRKHDLVKGPVFSKFDLILCRNVMIYFNQELQNDVLTKLHESLFKYGVLAVGSKESLIWCDISHKFIILNNEEKIYRKIKE
ncbi:CheR family methyltransferase [Sediminitomix flava]|uniref:CheR-type MCP methyltransferase n=1 Tax=Sediminitomix flava TaxID=379075 RepID=A0A315ZGH4_SEDFL|nr:protein-glutamate O-methyltransferase CheR [Sediminitomix flava]PWJ44686.1 CheR-type MCP methyltransferase [Sediminitomix flava]